MNRIQSLDGLRAISILLVLLAHAGDTMAQTFHNNPLFPFITNSIVGVRVFFVISGYLITKLLIAEREKYGYVDLRNFYVRRAFRIFPIFYLYILTVVVIKYFFIHNIYLEGSRPVVAGLYLWNYQHLFFDASIDHNATWFFGHFWSLAMEEQFYLLWPLIFIKVPKEKLAKVVVVILTIMPLLRLITYFFIPGSDLKQVGKMLHTGGDTILIGCLGALLEKNIQFKEKYKIYIRNKWVVAAAALYLFILDKLLRKYVAGVYDLALGTSLTNICIIILVFWAVYVRTAFTKLLNAKAVVAIGVLSYSLYIWQQLFLTPLIDSPLNKFPLNLVAAFIVANISYYLIEKPILGLKNKFQRKHKSRELVPESLAA